MLKTFQFFRWLSRHFFKQLRTGSILLNLVMKLVNIVAERHDEHFSPHFLVAAQQKLPESIILLDDTKRAFNLN